VKFGRTYTLTIDTIRITGLSISFEVVKTRKVAPNTCKIEIRNLSQDQREKLSALSVIIPKSKSGAQQSALTAKVRGQISTVLAVGYDTQEVIFTGDLRTAQHKKEGGTWITSIEGSDAGKSMLTARVLRSFPPGTRVSTVVRAAAEALGVGLGNLPDVLETLRTAAGETFRSGTVLAGKANEELRGLLASCGYTYSVQNGVLQVAGVGAVAQRKAVLLTRDTGLESVPYHNPDGSIQVKSRIVPGLYPGAIVDVRSIGPSGQFQIEKVTYKGDLHARDWSAEMECSK
jgi:hypothetical protein